MSFFPYPNYPNYAEIQEVVCRIVQAVTGDMPTLFSDIQVESIENTFILEESSKKKGIITIEPDFRDPILPKQANQTYFLNNSYSVPAYIRLRLKNEAGAIKNIREIVDYLKQALTINNNNQNKVLPFTTTLTTAQGYTNSVYTCRLDKNLDLFDEPARAEIDNETKFWFYEFKILFYINKT